MSLLAAFQFLTIIPLWTPKTATPEKIRHSLAFFPLVGAVIGLAMALLDKGMLEIFPSRVSSVVLLAALVIVTGAIHMDGLIDTCDGLLGGKTPERRLEIMKDPRVGAFGVLGAVFVLMIKWGALMSLGAPVRASGIILFPVAGRAAMAIAVNRFRYARAEGTGRIFADGPTDVPMMFAVLTALVAATLLFGWQGIVLMLACGAFAITVALYIKSRIGGLTGDSYGAINEITEVAMLLGLLAFARYGWLHPLLWKG